MKTQQQHAEASRRKAADKAHGFNWLLQRANWPTAAELEQLRIKRPSLWNNYSDKTTP